MLWCVIPLGFLLQLGLLHYFFFSDRRRHYCCYGYSDGMTLDAYLEAKQSARTTSTSTRPSRLLGKNAHSDENGRHTDRSSKGDTSGGSTGGGSAIIPRKTTATAAAAVIPKKVAPVLLPPSSSNAMADNSEVENGAGSEDNNNNGAGHLVKGTRMKLKGFDPTKAAPSGQVRRGLCVCEVREGCVR